MSIQRSSNTGSANRATARLIVPTLVVAALASMIICGASARALAQGPSPKVLDACAQHKHTISTKALPEKVAAPRCPFDGRAVVDNGVSAVVPKPGMGIYAEVLSTDGVQELLLERSDGGTLTVRSAGDEIADERSRLPSVLPNSNAGPEAANETARASSRRDLAGRASPGECSDSAYKGFSWRVSHYMRWRFNVRTTPSELSKLGARTAISREGRNVFDTVNRCRMGDRVPSHLIYEGTTSRATDITSNAGCESADRESVVGFGTLPRGWLGMTCDSYWVHEGWDKPATSGSTRPATVGPTARLHRLVAANTT